MKKALFLGVVVFAAPIGMATHAYGQIPSTVMTTITNETDRCAWITVYTSRPGAPWESWGVAFWLKSGAIWNKVIPFIQPPLVTYPSEIRVRAEFMTNNACDHPVFVDTYAERKGMWGKNSTAHFTLERRKTKYWVTQTGD